MVDMVTEPVQAVGDSSDDDKLCLAPTETEDEGEGSDREVDVKMVSRAMNKSEVCSP